MHAPPPARHLATATALALLLAGAVPAPAQGNVVAGSGQVVATDVPHPNGNIYDQVLLTGPSVTVRADPGQVVRCSFLDLTGDIVQCEFSGPGTCTIELEPATYQPAAAPARYHQPGVAYVTGHATVTVGDPTADTHLAVFSVGPRTALNATLFPAGQAYDALADLQLVRVHGAAVGSLLLGNVRFGAAAGETGIAARDTAVRDRVILHDIAASGSAQPVLQIGVNSLLARDAGAVLLAGGTLGQPNLSRVDVTSGLVDTLRHLVTVENVRSDGSPLPRRPLLQADLFQCQGPGALFVDGMPRFPFNAGLDLFFPEILQGRILTRKDRRSASFASPIPVLNSGAPYQLGRLMILQSGSNPARFESYWITVRDTWIHWEIIFQSGQLLEISLYHGGTYLGTWS